MFLFLCRQLSSYRVFPLPSLAHWATGPPPTPAPLQPLSWGIPHCHSFPQFRSRPSSYMERISVLSTASLPPTSSEGSSEGRCSILQTGKSSLQISEAALPPLSRGPMSLWRIRSPLCVGLTSGLFGSGMYPRFELKNVT